MLFPGSRELLIKITFIDEVLGMTSSDKEMYKSFIGKNAPDAPTLEEEIARLGTDEVVQQGKTIFPKWENGTPLFYAYQWKGYFKDACGMVRRVPNSHSSKCKAYKKEIDGLVFVSNPDYEPTSQKYRQIPIIIPEGETIGNCDRQLRASTPMGERTALASSETVPAGSTCVFKLTIMNSASTPMILEWLDYGMARGTGGWRNSDKGRFVYEILEDSEGKLAKPSGKKAVRSKAETKPEDVVTENTDEPAPKAKRGRPKKSES